MRRTILVAALMSLWFAAEAAAGGPTLFLFKTDEKNLIAASSGGNATPVSIVFADDARFSDDLARRVGEALMPDDEGGRYEAIRAFHQELRVQHGVSIKPSGYFSADLLRRLTGKAGEFRLETLVGAVRILNLNQVPGDPHGATALREFIHLVAAQSGGVLLTESQVERCRAGLMRDLQAFVDRTEPMLLVGLVRGALNYEPCGAAAAVPIPEATAAETVVPLAPPEKKSRRDEAGRSRQIPLTDEKSGSGRVLLTLALVLLGAAGFLLVYFWQKDKLRRLARERLRRPDVPEDFRLQEEPFARHAPGLHVGERTVQTPTTPFEPGPAKGTLAEQTVSVAIQMAIAQDEELDMAERIAIQKLGTELEKLQHQVDLMSSGLAKINQRLDQIAKQGGAQAAANLEPRLQSLEAAMATVRQQVGKPVLDQAIYKKFNETELLISQSLNEMGRLLDEFRQRLGRLETRIFRD